MIQVPCPIDRLVVVGSFGGFTLEELFEFWTTPDLLCQWWPSESTLDVRVGGKYRLEWPDQGSYLQGEYTTVDPGKHLGFTWAWNHEPGVYEPLQVDVYFEAIDDGARIGIFHGPFEDPTDRQGAAEGWIHFGMRLAGLRDGKAL